MKAVITVLGCDKVGIIAGVSNILADSNANIVDISQTTMEDIFTMIMMVDISNINVDFSELKDLLQKKGHELGLEIRTQREEIFKSMHRI